LKPPDQVQSFTNHIHALRPLGGAYGLVELVPDLDYILELEWICGKMDTHYESFRVIKIITWRYGILVSN
jgi:hypothetical protein